MRSCLVLAVPSWPVMSRHVLVTPMGTPRDKKGLVLLIFSLLAFSGLSSVLDLIYRCPKMTSNRLLRFSISQRRRSDKLIEARACMFYFDEIRAAESAYRVRRQCAFPRHARTCRNYYSAENDVWCRAMVEIITVGLRRSATSCSVLTTQQTRSAGEL